MLGCKDFAPAALEACLQAANPRDILKVQDGVTDAGLAFLPVVDGDMLPDIPMVCFSSPISHFSSQVPTFYFKCFK